MKCNGKSEDIKEEMSHHKSLKTIESAEPILEIISHLEQLLSLVQLTLGGS